MSEHLPTKEELGITLDELSSLSPRAIAFLESQSEQIESLQRELAEAKVRIAELTELGQLAANRADDLERAAPPPEAAKCEWVGSPGTELEFAL